MLRLKDIKPGLIVCNEGECYELIEHSPSWRDDNVPWVAQETGGDDDTDGVIVNHAKQRWLVELPDGFRTHRYIEYRHSVGHIKLKNDDDVSV